jgi:hypothetical protein
MGSSDTIPDALRQWEASNAGRSGVPFSYVNAPSVTICHHLFYRSLAEHSLENRVLPLNIKKAKSFFFLKLGGAFDC